MSVNITFDGQPYIIPETGEVGWGGNTTSYLVAIAAGCLQKTGGSFTLSDETDFGAAFGLASISYKSRTADLADAGILRLANDSDAVSWRNAANDDNLSLLVDASNLLTFDGNTIYTIGAGTITNADIAGGAGIVYSKLNLTGGIVNADVNSAAAISFSKMAALTDERLPKINNLGIIVPSGWEFHNVNEYIKTGSENELRFTDGTTNYVSFRSPNVVVTHAYRLPIAQGAAGEVLANDGSGQLSWIAAAGGGTINSGTQFQLTYYAATGTTVSGLTLITASQALVSDANGLPVASVVSTVELAALSGLTASRALETDGNGLVSASTVTAAELAFVAGVTSAIQTQLDAKADDSAVVHLAGTETITGSKRFSLVVLGPPGTAAAPTWSFLVEASMGMFRPGAAILGFSQGGTESIRFDAIGLFLNTGTKDVIRIGSLTTGTNVATAIRLGNRAGSGLYASIQDHTQIASDGTEVANFFSTGNQFPVVCLFADGTAALPSIGLINSSTTGLYRVSANILGIAASAANVASFAVTGVSIKGTTTNDSASAGFVGEVFSANSGTTVAFPATTVYGDAASLALTAGEWDITFQLQTIRGTATWTRFETGISTTAGNSTTGLVLGDNKTVNIWTSSATTPEGVIATIANYRVQLASTTTHYAKIRSDYSAGQSFYAYRFSARRVR